MSYNKDIAIQFNIYHTDKNKLNYLEHFGISECVWFRLTMIWNVWGVGLTGQ